MVLVSTINVDLGSESVVLTASVSSDIVDVITYDNTTQQVTFDTRPGIIINFTEFLSFCDQVNIFQTAILFNYSPNIAATTPFTQILVNELHDPGMWNLTITPHTDPNIIEYQGTRSSSKVEMFERSMSKTLDFAEWVYFLVALNHYKLSIKAF